MLVDEGSQINETCETDKELEPFRIDFSQCEKYFDELEKC